MDFDSYNVELYELHPPDDLWTLWKVETDFTLIDSFFHRSLYVLHNFRTN